MKVLEDILQQGGDRGLIAESLLAMAKLGDPAVIEASVIEPRIRSYLDNADQYLRDAALLAMGVLCNSASVAPVSKLLEEQTRAVAGGKPPRFDAVLVPYCLGRIGAWSGEPHTGDVAEFLRRRMRSTTDPTVEGAFVQALGIAYLEQLVPAPGKVSLPERLELLLALLEDTGRAPEVRAMAAWALPRSVQFVGTAAEGWAASATQRVAETLLTSAGDTEAPLALRRQALLALGTLARGTLPFAQRVRISEVLTNAAKEKDDTTSAAYAFLALAALASDPGAVGELPARATACLVERLDGPEALRPWAALACGLMGWELADRGDHPKEVDALRAAVRERLVASRPEIGAYAVSAVLLGDAGALLWLLEQLGTAAPERARELALALGQATASDPPLAVSEKELESLHAAIPTLRERMRGIGDDAELLVALALARKGLGDRTLGMDLLPGIVAGEPPARCAWIDAVVVTESARAIEPLTKLLADPEQPATVRVRAARALGDLANKEFFPWTAVFVRDLDLASAPSVLFDSFRR